MISFEYACQKWCPWVHFSKLTSLWPPVTSGDLLWLLRLKCHRQYCSGIKYEHKAKNWVPWCIFQIWPLLTTCYLRWPLLSFKVKILYHILVKDIIWVCRPKIEFLGIFFNFDILLTSGDLIQLLRSKCHRRCWSGIWYENKCQKLGPLVHFSKLTSFWPPLTSDDLL